MTPLKANDCLCMIGQPVNDFALPFVTPLGADHYNITTRLRHMNSSLFLFVLKGLLINLFCLYLPTSTLLNKLTITDKLFCAGFITLA